MTNIISIDERVKPYLDARGEVPGGDPEWLLAARDQAVDALTQRGFPTRRVEDWKYTDVTRLLRKAPTPVMRETGGDPDVSRYVASGEVSARIVLLNGYFMPALSELPSTEGLAIRSFADTEKTDIGGTPFVGEDAAFAALNLIGLGDGIVIDIAAGAELAAPVEILHLRAGSGALLAHDRVHIRAGKNARAGIREIYAADTGGWTNAVTEVDVAASAAVDHVKIQRDTEDGWHIGMLVARVAAAAAFNTFTLSIGARTSRHDVRIALDGQGANCRLSGIHLGEGRQHVDSTTVVSHNAPDTNCDESYRAVLDDEAHSVFQGLVRVAPDAQRINANQMVRNVLLSPRAQADAKPELEIHADDVKCSHGATVGKLDDAALFYLRSRGIPQERARALLVRAFLAEVMDDISDAALRARMDEILDDWLARSGQQSEQAA